MANAHWIGNAVTRRTAPAGLAATTAMTMLPGAAQLRDVTLSCRSFCPGHFLGSGKPESAGSSTSPRQMQSATGRVFPSAVQ